MGNGKSCSSKVIKPSLETDFFAIFLIVEENLHL